MRKNRGVRAWAARGEGAKNRGLPLGRKPREGGLKAGGCCEPSEEKGGPVFGSSALEGRLLDGPAG